MTTFVSVPFTLIGLPRKAPRLQCRRTCDSSRRCVWLSAQVHVETNPLRNIRCDVSTKPRGCSSPTRTQFAVNSGSGASGGNNGRHTTKTWRRNDDDGSDSGPSFHFSSAATVALARRRTTEFDPRRGRYRRPPSSFEEFLRGIRLSHVLLALNVAVFAIQSMYGPGILMGGAKVNSAIAAGEYYRLFSPMFLHASITHLMVNSFSLHSTGPSVESWFGKSRFLALYLASGVSGNLLSYFCSPVPAVGASGAIFGLVGASVVILGRHRRILGPRARRGLQSLAYIVLMNFGMGMAPGSRVDNFGHLGGFLGGIAYSYLLGPRLVLKRGRSGRAILQDEPIFSSAWAELRERITNVRSLLNRK